MSNFGTILFCACLFVGVNAFPQARLHELLRNYKKSAADTNRVNLLLEITSIYLYEKPDHATVLDSALMMAKQAKVLSDRLQFNSGKEKAIFYIADSYREKKDIKSARLVMKTTSGPLRVHILISLGEHYMFRPGVLSANLDTAYLFIREANTISESIHLIGLQHKSLRALAKYYFSRGEIKLGANAFKKVIDQLHHAGDSAKEAFWWSEFALYMPDTDSTYKDRILYFEQALLLYNKLNITHEIPGVLKTLASVHSLHNRYDLSEQYLLEGIRIKKSLGLKKLQSYYLLLSKACLNLGKHDEALRYALLGFDNADSLGENYYLGSAAYQLASVYDQLGETDKALRWYQFSLDNPGANWDVQIFPICARIVNGFLERKKPNEALEFLKRMVSENVPIRFVDKKIVASSFGDCYNALRKYDQAEKKYLEMIAWDAEAVLHLKKEMWGYDVYARVTTTEAYFKIGNFYVRQNRYQLARPYLEKVLRFENQSASLAQKMDTHLLLFKVDSAENKYFSAINHFRQHKALSDSIFTKNRSKQIAELQIKYETEKKEQDIQLLSRQAQLQHSELNQIGLIKNITVAGAALLLLIIGILFIFLRHRLTIQKKMQLQQSEINSKNISLQQLVVEKEWLVKEIHHRVKNNFQTVMGLLATQSNYLKNEEALIAIRDSQHRIHAMSLIHQKLYQSTDLSAINIKDYIHDLVEYLKDSFDTSRIQFDIQVIPITFAVSYALPIGLIINEAVTNSIKYAYKNNDGLISILLHHGSTHEIVLTIADNGAGLPTSFKFGECSSMGMNLLRGLTEDIGGRFTIKNNNGVFIQIAFNQNADFVSVPDSLVSQPIVL